MSTTQVADTYTGKVKYALVYPPNEEPVQPQSCVARYICYFANASTAEGTMGRQSAKDGNTVILFASNFVEMVMVLLAGPMPLIMLLIRMLTSMAPMKILQYPQEPQLMV